MVRPPAWRPGRPEARTRSEPACLPTPGPDRLVLISYGARSGGGALGTASGGWRTDVTCGKASVLVREAERTECPSVGGEPPPHHTAAATPGWGCLQSRPSAPGHGRGGSPPWR